MKKTLRKVIFALCAFMFTSNIAISQEKNEIVTIDKLSIEGRVDFDYSAGEGEPIGCNVPVVTNSGFNGRNLNFEIKGSLFNDFSYRLRQRFDMSRYNLVETFTKTDIMTLSYHAGKNFSFTAGKMALGVGGWEYDLAPIDVYYASNFWNTFDCYEVGAQVEFHTNNKNHDIILQVTNSTFSPNKLGGMYAYNLIWYGNMGPFKTSYSINMIEQKKGEYINYIALGNMFDFDRLDFYIDFMNRAFFDQKDFLLGDFTLIGEVKYAFTNKFTAVAKGGYDRNKHSYFEEVEEKGVAVKRPLAYDMTVTPNVEYAFAGLGFEAYPYKGNKNIRLHGFVAVNTLYKPTLEDDMTTVTLPTMEKMTLQANVGVTWRINFVK